MENLIVYPDGHITTTRDTIVPTKFCIVSFTTILLKKKAILVNLETFLQTLKSCLSIGDDILGMLRFFSLKNSMLFFKFTKESMKEREKVPVSKYLPITMSRSDTSSVSHIGLAGPIFHFGKALEKTHEFIVDLIQGKATYASIMQSGILGNTSMCFSDDFKVEMTTIKHELAIVEEYGLTLKNVTKDIGGVYDLVGLLGLLKHIEQILMFCREFNITGCLEDPLYDELNQIVELFKDENQLKLLTMQKATEYMQKVTRSLGLEQKEYLCGEYMCLDVFPVVANSRQLCQFLEANNFLGEEGRINFHNMYELVTRQLQHEEYEQSVLNSFGGTFHFLYPLLQSNQTVKELVSVVTKLNPTTAISQLETVNSNLTQINIWLASTKVSVR